MCLTLLPDTAVHPAQVCLTDTLHASRYFKKYNYDVVETGDTIRFAGTYAASRGQAAALIFYVFCGAPPAHTCVTHLPVFGISILALRACFMLQAPRDGCQLHACVASSLCCKGCPMLQMPSM